MASRGINHAGGMYQNRVACSTLYHWPAHRIDGRPAYLLWVGQRRLPFQGKPCYVSKPLTCVTFPWVKVITIPTRPTR